MASLTLPERQQNLKEQLRARRTKLAEVQTAAETLRTQCAQIEGALALCDALLNEGYDTGILGTPTTGDGESPDA